MRSFTSCNIGGNLGADPEIRYTKAGDPVATLSVAVNYKKKDAEDETIWTRLTVFGTQGEWLKEAKKGDFVIATGMRYHVDEWEGKDGDIRKTHHFRTAYGSEVMFFKKGSFSDPSKETPHPLSVPDDGSGPAFPADEPDKRVDNSSPQDIPPNEEVPF